MFSTGHPNAAVVAHEILAALRLWSSSAAATPPERIPLKEVASASAGATAASACDPDRSGKREGERDKEREREREKKKREGGRERERESLELHSYIEELQELLFKKLHLLHPKPKKIPHP